jgi:hypothetical protein
MASVVGGVLVTMAGQLMTERFLKRMIYQGLKVVVKRTETDEDDKVLSEAGKAWGLE